MEPEIEKKKASLFALYCFLFFQETMVIRGNYHALSAQMTRERGSREPSRAEESARDTEERREKITGEGGRERERKREDWQSIHMRDA